ncbi:MAG: OadG family transporter subunit [Bacteroidaceae bacterium]|nr:OadG family transporter subunit [Bacteroidaceae bacterium]
MNILAVTTETWGLAGVSVAVVFAILVVLVWILNIFSLLARKTVTKASSAKVAYNQQKQAKTFANASDEDKAAVAMALYLYEQDKKNQESRVLTITHTSQTWTSQLNPRL